MKWEKMLKLFQVPFKDFVGEIRLMSYDKGKVEVIVSMFGRDTSVELDFNQILKI